MTILGENMIEEELKKNAEFLKGDTYDVNDVEIFSAGKWNGDEYTRKDLDDMVASHYELRQEVKPYLKLGHDKKQELLQSDGMPSAGWVTNLKRSGDKLLADFKSVPKKIKELIEKRAYGRFSSEIYWNLKTPDGKNFRRVLKAVALLGGDTPAVSNLNDFINLYTENNDFETIKNYHIIKEDTKMSEELIKSLEDKLVKAEKSYSESLLNKDAEVVEYKQSVYDLETQVKVLTESIEKKEKENKLIEVKAYIQRKLDENKILPSQVEKYTELAVSNFEQVQSIVDNMPELVDLSEGSQAALKVKKYSEMDAEEKDNYEDQKAQEYMKKNDTSYREAIKIVKEELEV
jgi:hypothetical protein